MFLNIFKFQKSIRKAIQAINSLKLYILFIYLQNKLTYIYQGLYSLIITFFMIPIMKNVFLQYSFKF